MDGPSARPAPAACCCCAAAAEAQAAFWLGRGLSREQVVQMLVRWPKVSESRHQGVFVVLDEAGWRLQIAVEACIRDILCSFCLASSALSSCRLPPMPPPQLALCRVTDCQLALEYLCDPYLGVEGFSVQDVPCECLGVPCRHSCWLLPAIAARLRLHLR